VRTDVFTLSQAAARTLGSRTGGRACVPAPFWLFDEHAPRLVQAFDSDGHVVAGGPFGRRQAEPMRDDCFTSAFIAGDAVGGVAQLAGHRPGRVVLREDLSDGVCGIEVLECEREESSSSLGADPATLMREAKPTSRTIEKSRAHMLTIPTGASPRKTPSPSCQLVGCQL